MRLTLKEIAGEHVHSEIKRIQDEHRAALIGEVKGWLTEGFGDWWTSAARPTKADYEAALREVVEEWLRNAGADTFDEKTTHES